MIKTIARGPLMQLLRNHHPTVYISKCTPDVSSSLLALYTVRITGTLNEILPASVAVSAGHAWIHSWTAKMRWTEICSSYLLVTHGTICLFLFFFIFHCTLCTI